MVHPASGQMLQHVIIDGVLVISVAQAVILTWENEHVESLAGPDERVGHAQGASGVHVVVHVAVDE